MLCLAAKASFFLDFASQSIIVVYSARRGVPVVGATGRRPGVPRPLEESMDVGCSLGDVIGGFDNPEGGRTRDDGLLPEGAGTGGKGCCP